MFSRCLLAAAVLCPCVSFAQDGQPSQQIVHFEANGSISLTGQVSKPVYETMQYQYTVMVNSIEKKEVTVDGVTKMMDVTVCKPETRTAIKTVCKNVCVAECSPLDLKTAKAFEVDGRRIPIGELTKRLTNDSVVIISATEGMIPDYYASIYKPGTIILGSPKMNMGMPAPMPGPVMAPQPPAVPAAPVAPPVTSYRLGPLVVQPVGFQPAAPAPPIAVPVGERAPGPWDLLPQSPAPLIAFATRTGADELKIRQLAERHGETEFAIVAGEGASAQEVKKMSPTVTRHSETVTLPMKSLRFGTAAADDITAERIKEKLGATEQTVLLSADGKPVDEFWLKTIKPSVLVLRGVKLHPVSAIGSPPGPQNYVPASPVYAPAMPVPAAPGPTPAPAAPAPSGT